MNTIILVLYILGIILGISALLHSFKLVRVQRMGVKWVSRTAKMDAHGDPEEPAEFSHNIYIVVIRGSARDIAIRAAEMRRF